MADLSRVKVGDTLVFKARVASVNGEMVGLSRPESSDTSNQFYLGGRWIEAAEHIPAPKVFKRGDWVKWVDGIRVSRHCLVLGPSGSGESSLALRIDDPFFGACIVPIHLLEPDEAPND